MQTEFIDRVLICVDCRCQFVFTAGEQIFFVDKQFKNDPKRCKACKQRRAGKREAGCVPGGKASPGALARTETRTECSECRIETTVPFRPTQGRPVLCRLCYQAKRKETSFSLAEAKLSGAIGRTLGEGNGAPAMETPQATHTTAQ